MADEVTWYKTKEAKKLPARCELFVTPLSDVEHQYCQHEHISEALNISLDNARSIVSAIMAANNASFAADFANKRTDLKSKALKGRDDTPSAADLLKGQIAFEYVKGKRLFGLLCNELTAQHHNPMHLSTKRTSALAIPELTAFARKVWDRSVPKSVPSEMQCG